MKVLFIGGTGIISSACSALAIEQGIELFHFNRGNSFRKIAGVTTIQGDIRDVTQAKQLLAEHHFDVVVDWVAFVTDHIRQDIELFRHTTRQFIFISSASAYRKPVGKLPITEETPLENPFWQYSRDKIACEQRLMEAYREEGFPVTIVRPSHTYDKTLVPCDWGYTALDRIKQGKPVIIHGDGTSLWVMTHHQDFAVGLNGLFGKEEALGQAYHITSEEALSWNQIYALLADAYGKKGQFVHIPSDLIARYDHAMGCSLLGDKSHSVIFDNSKIRRLVPAFNPVKSFEQGAAEIVRFYEENPKRQVVDNGKEQRMETILKVYAKAMA